MGADESIRAGNKDEASPHPQGHDLCENPRVFLQLSNRSTSRSVGKFLVVDSALIRECKLVKKFDFPTLVLGDSSVVVRFSSRQDEEIRGCPDLELDGHFGIFSHQTDIYAPDPCAGKIWITGRPRFVKYWSRKISYDGVLLILSLDG